MYVTLQSNKLVFYFYAASNSLNLVLSPLSVVLLAFAFATSFVPQPVISMPYHWPTDEFNTSYILQYRKCVQLYNKENCQNCKKIQDQKIIV